MSRRSTIRKMKKVHMVLFHLFKLNFRLFKTNLKILTPLWRPTELLSSKLRKFLMICSLPKTRESKPKKMQESNKSSKDNRLKKLQHC